MNMKRRVPIFLFAILVFGVVNTSMARDIGRFIPLVDENKSNVLRPIVFSYDSQNDRYRYRLLANQISGVPLLHLDDGASIVAEQTDDGFYKINYVSLKNDRIQELHIEGVVAKSLQAIHAREGDKRSVHLAWLQSDQKTLSYAHVDDSAKVTHTLNFEYENEVRLPPPFFMLPHVLVGRHHVGLLRSAEKEGNPVAVLDIFSIGYDQIGSQVTVSGRDEAAQETCEGNDFKGAFVGVISDLGNCVRSEDPAAEPAKPVKQKGLFKIESDIEVGSPIQPQGDHAWYGNTYLSLSYHIAPNGIDMEFRRVAILLGDDGAYTNSKEIGTDISLLSNLAGPINSYQGEIGRGGIAWLEGRPGNEILVNVFREGSLDTAMPLNAEVAGAIALGHTGKKTLYWIDQGEMFQPILFVLTGMGNLYQVDLEVPDAFTVMPSDEPVGDILIWPAMSQDDSTSIAFVASINDNGNIRDIYHLSKRWKGANLNYVWERLEE